ncbi:MAG: ECF transporter S component [Clostridia bacterium]|nr:ECF transporter S component [Clostridia bacterium]
MSNTSTFKIVLTSLFAALICVATMLVQIPIPATGGFANLGDGVILMCAFLMNPVNAILAAGLGSMLADILAGYISFAPGTLVIKAGVALIAAYAFNHFGRNRSARMQMVVMIAVSILAEVFMILGYFFYEAVCLGIGMSAAGAIIGNVGQGGVAVIVACIVTPVLARSHEVRELMGKTRR